MQKTTKKDQELCLACHKLVYDLEKAVLGVSYHKTCFKCFSCQTPLSVGNFKKNGNQYYCTVHAKEVPRINEPSTDYQLSRISHEVKDVNSTESIHSRNTWWFKQGKDQFDKILIIYSGGTFGCIDGTPQSLDKIEEKLKSYPDLQEFCSIIEYTNTPTPVDSSNAGPKEWEEIAKLIDKKWKTSKYKGFVLISGTDTLAYIASALCFLFRCIEFPVIVTGAQVPIFRPNSDGWGNLYGSILAAQYRTQEHKNPIQEVCVYFDHKLLRGNRTVKLDASGFAAFKTPNAPVLGVLNEEPLFDDFIIDYVAKKRIEAREKDRKKQLEYKKSPNLKKIWQWHPPEHIGYKLYCLSRAVMIVTLFPGMPENFVTCLITQFKPKGVVIEAYGCGNGPEHVVKEIENTKKIIFVAVTQCIRGATSNKYATSLKNANVIICDDMTLEAAATKLAVLLGKYEKCPIEYYNREFNNIQKEMDTKMTTSYRGEKTPNPPTGRRSIDLLQGRLD